MKRSAHGTKKIILIGADIALLYLSLWIALAIRYQSAFGAQIFNDHLYPFSVSFALWIVIFYAAGLYEQGFLGRAYTFYATSAKAIITAIITAMMLFYLVPSFGITPKTNLLLTAFVFFIFFLAWRHTWAALARSQRLLHTIICVGSNKEMADIVRIISEHPQLGYRVAHIIDQHEDLTHLKETVQRHKAAAVVYAHNAFPENISGALYALVPLGIAIVDLPTFFAHITRKIPVSIIGQAWFLENLIEREKNVFEIQKRFIDVAGSLICLAISLPFLPFIAAAIRADSKGPILYTQKRVGKNGSIFKLLKFRTMIEGAEAGGAKWTAMKDARITRVGKWIRRVRIDELPQLWNVLLGDMSFIGPRPERPEFVEKLEKEVPHYHMRLLVKPGLTGWAQVHEPQGGASVKDTLEKLQYDLYYIKYRDLIMDLDIILKTIPVILGRKGH
ncbi:sugar transferase [Candidatus Azambacteria bacterium]|nr:sugar transferase [Candidatus Azambacteria bacterium]